MLVYPIVSNVNGTVIAGHKSQDGALGVASALVRHAGGADLVHVGEPFESELTGGMLMVAGVTVPLNPVYALAKDPYRLMVTRLLDMARAPRKRTRNTTAKATTAKATTGAAKATGTGARAAKSGAAKSGAAKSGRAGTRARVTAGATA